MSNIINLCLDLNIWCAALLADKKGRQGTSCQILVDIVRHGYCALGYTQLVISWGMLNRLKLVLERDLMVSQDLADLYIDAIIEYAKLGPQLTLGGTGVIPLKDTEDAHVFETVIAGKAQVLITANFQDFLAKGTQIILPGRHGIYISPAHSFSIVHPYLMVEWLRIGTIPEIK